jgi:two-component system KDP operon response regulator KdpE
LQTEDIAKRKRVLVVDDQLPLLKFIEVKLRLCGCEVITASSGREALELARSAKPDIMLLDIIMPGMDGFEVLRELRTFTELPVIVLSARPCSSNQAMSLGANSFIHKPFDPEELVKRIKVLTGAGAV